MATASQVDQTSKGKRIHMKCEALQCQQPATHQVKWMEQSDWEYRGVFRTQPEETWVCADHSALLEANVHIITWTLA